MLFLSAFITSYQKIARRASKDLYKPLSKPVAPEKDVYYNADYQKGEALCFYDEDNPWCVDFFIGVSSKQSAVSSKKRPVFLTAGNFHNAVKLLARLIR